MSQTRFSKPEENFYHSIFSNQIQIELTDEIIKLFKTIGFTLHKGEHDAKAMGLDAKSTQLFLSSKELSFTGIVRDILISLQISMLAETQENYPALIKTYVDVLMQFLKFAYAQFNPTAKFSDNFSDFLNNLFTQSVLKNYKKELFKEYLIEMTSLVPIPYQRTPSDFLHTKMGKYTTALNLAGQNRFNEMLRNEIYPAALERFNLYVEPNLSYLQRGILSFILIGASSLTSYGFLWGFAFACGVGVHSYGQRFHLTEASKAFFMKAGIEEFWKKNELSARTLAKRKVNEETILYRGMQAVCAAVRENLLMTKPNRKLFAAVDAKQESEWIDFTFTQTQLYTQTQQAKLKNANRKGKQIENASASAAAEPVDDKKREVQLPKPLQNQGKLLTQNNHSMLFVYKPSADSKIGLDDVEVVLDLRAGFARNKGQTGLKHNTSGIFSLKDRHSGIRIECNQQKPVSVLVNGVEQNVPAVLPTKYANK